MADDAPASLTNSATVSGGGDSNPNNNTAQSVANIAPSLAPIESWRTLHFGTAESSGVAADTYVATEDGMPNLLKYALGLNPTNSASVSNRPSLEIFPPLAIKFRRARDASDVTMIVQAAEALTNSWTNIWTSTTNAYGGGSNSFEEVIVQDPLSDTNTPRRFLRLKVTRP